MRPSTHLIAVALAGCAAVTANAGVLITEIMYNPAGADGVPPPAPTGEWVEICNTGLSTVDLSGWRLDDEDSTDWGVLPAGTTLAPGQVAVFCSNPVEFAQAWGAQVKTFGVRWGSLANSASATNEVLTLLNADGTEVDRANYETGTAGWPPSINGASIALRNVSLENNTGANWSISTVGVDGGCQPFAGVSPYDAGDVGSPGTVPNLVPLAPARGTTITSTSVPLTVQAMGTGTDPITVKFYGRSLLTSVQPPPFRIVVLPDTQYYSQTYASTFVTQVQWILNHREDMNIAYVAHVGDIVNRAEESYQWVNANAAMSLFDAVPGLPLGIAIGNHDQYPNGDPEGTAAFNQRFPYTRYQGRPWYGGHHGSDYDNNYVLFSASGMDFIAIHLEYAVSPSAEVLTWAANLLQVHSSRRAIVVSHSMLNPGDSASRTNSGQVIYNALRDRPNLVLMLCGHIAGEGRRTDFAAGTFHTLLADYQTRTAGGDGWLRILEFVPVDNVINVRTYSPKLDRYEMDADSEFSLWHTMSGASLVLLGEASLPAAGGTLTWTWQGLDPTRTYQWFATAGSGSMLVKCPLQEFVTAYARPDLNQDGDVDRDDVTVFLNCWTGPEHLYAPPAMPGECPLTPGGDGTIAADDDRDGDVDQDDFAALQRCLGNVPCN